MLWLKAWLETRWRLFFMLLMGALLLALPVEALGNARPAHPQQLIAILLQVSVFVSFVGAIMLAGNGIETASPRPGPSEHSNERSMLFTLSLPVTRTRLFAVRTIIGLVETVVLLASFGAVVVWLLIPRYTVNGHQTFAYFAVLISCAFSVYAISACLSTFCDEGWRFRGSALVVTVLFMFGVAGKLPRSINVFRAFAVTSPPATFQILWEAIAAACVLAFLFLAAALLIVQRREY